jgi:hypothetical protein
MNTELALSIILATYLVINTLNKYDFGWTFVSREDLFTRELRANSTTNYILQ